MHGGLIGVLVVAMAASPPANASATRQSPAQTVVSPQLPAPDPNAPPVVDIALRQILASSGGSSIARSMSRGNADAFLYAGLGPCIVGASQSDRAAENSVTWRASGNVKSVERGIGVAEVEWQRIEYRPSGVVAGPRVRMTFTMPLGERVAVDFVETPGTTCRADALVFEVGIAADHGRRLSMSAEGRLAVFSEGGRAGGGGGAGGGRGTPEWPDQIERRRQGAEAARAAAVVIRPMPPRQYGVDVWLVPSGLAGASSKPLLSQRMSQVVGGTGGRFVFPQIAAGGAAEHPVTVEISALVIPITGDQLIVAISRYPSSSDGPLPIYAGWLRVVPMPKADDVLSFALPGVGLGAPATSIGERQVEVRVKIAKQ